MDQFRVEGKRKIKGDFIASGNKNEALPVLCASLLTDEMVTITNLPDIQDIRVLKKIIQSFGVVIHSNDPHEINIDPLEFKHVQENDSDFAAIRGSFLLAVPLLRKFGQCLLPLPGGDVIGKRRLDTHLEAFQKFGVTISRGQGYYELKAKELLPAHVFLDEASVMATENAIMAAACADGTSTIYNAACEPHVQGLCNMLVNMGAEIQGIGTNLLTIKGTKNLGGCLHKIMPDHIEIGSIIGLAAICGEGVTITNGGEANMGLIGHYFSRLGVSYKKDGNSLYVPKDQELRVKLDFDRSIPKIDDSPWPGFPADLTSIMVVVASQCEGTVLIFEKMFESRLFWVDRLISMGGRAILCDPHRLVVNGPSPLIAEKLVSPDIRAGMALLIAAMVAEGTSEIGNIQQIDRGYERIEHRLNSIGASIVRS